MSSDSRQARVGIDIGRVIIEGPAHPGGGNTAFFQGDEATMLATPDMAGSVAAISRLVDLFADKRVHCEELGLTHFVDDHPAVHRNWADAEVLIKASLAARSQAAAPTSELAVHDVQADPAAVGVLEGTGDGSDDGEAQPLVDLDG